jgi:hypothetical protein
VYAVHVNKRSRVTGQCNLGRLEALLQCVIIP